MFTSREKRLMNSFKIIRDKIITWQELYDLRQRWAASKLKVVFTNGCFDIVHYGHISYLSKAADLGNKLIIALNSDSSVKKIKGESRPINNEMARASLLASLFFVDAVVLFNDETPYNLISLILPDILVKGNDYKEEEIAGADVVRANGGQIILIPLVKGYSTTSIINKNSRN